MDSIKLILPDPEYKDQVLAYKEEFIKNNDSMDGCARLEEFDNFEDWYISVYNSLRGKNIKEGMVPATTYLAIRVDDKKVVGMVDIRHRLNPFLANFGGHIGYSVRKSERNKGYGTEILAKALKICKDMSLDNVLVTCKKGNIASEKIIKKNGGFFYKEVPFKDTYVKHYWIKLNDNLK